MKTNTAILSMCAVLASAGISVAGLSSPDPVTISTDASTGRIVARGSLRDARNSQDALAYIGCN